MTCKNVSTEAVCLLRADGTRISAVAHYEYGSAVDGQPVKTATVYTDASGDVVYTLGLGDFLTVGVCEVNDWKESQAYICDQDDERFGHLVCFDYGYAPDGSRVYPEGELPVYKDQKTGEPLDPQPVLVGKANPLSVPESTYKCYTATGTELQTTASSESGTLIWDDTGQGTDLDNAFNFTVSDVGGLAGLTMDFSLDESDGLGSVFATDSSNGSTNSDNGGAYQFRASFEGQTDQNSRLRHVMDFSEPVIVDNFFVGDIDRGGDQTQADIVRWQDAARVYGIDSAGNEVPFEQIPGADLVVHSNGFTYMPQDAVEQAGDEDAGNWLTVNSQGSAIVTMIVEYFPGTDAGWNSDETGDANYGIPNSSSRMQLHNLEVTRATEEVVEVETTRSACATLDTDGSEVWRDAITLAGLSGAELVTLVSCEPSAQNTHLIEGCIEVDGEKASAFTIVDDSGEALFTPKLLSDIGFEDCC